MLILLKWICYFKYRSQKFNWIIKIIFFDKFTLYLFVIYLDYIKNVKKKQEIKQKCFLKRQKKLIMKYINALKKEWNKQMYQVCFECMHLC